MIKLYGYWRSSASYRVRIALNLKGVDYEYHAVNLKASEHLVGPYVERNSQMLVPVIELESGEILTQSLAILDYLEDEIPTPALLPSNSLQRAKIRSSAHLICSDIAPIQNLRVLKYIREEYGQQNEDISNWAVHWIYKGFVALETILANNAQRFLLSNEPGYFECCLIPQVYNALRFEINMTGFPNIQSIYDASMQYQAFQDAAPENQPDAPTAAN